jgi:hypothetical protein
VATLRFPVSFRVSPPELDRSIGEAHRILNQLAQIGYLEVRLASDLAVCLMTIPLPSQLRESLSERREQGAILFAPPARGHAPFWEERHVPQARIGQRVRVDVSDVPPAGTPMGDVPVRGQTVVTVPAAQVTLRSKEAAPKPAIPAASAVAGSSATVARSTPTCRRVRTKGRG